MTFQQYLAGLRITDTPRGDFIGDARGDRRFAQATIETAGQLDTFLMQHSACDEACRQARKLWRAYQRARAQ